MTSTVSLLATALALRAARLTLLPNRHPQPRARIPSRGAPPSESGGAARVDGRACAAGTRAAERRGQVFDGVDQRGQEGGRGRGRGRGVFEPAQAATHARSVPYRVVRTSLHFQKHHDESELGIRQINKSTF